MTWDEYYIKIAKTVAEKSKDPSTKVGCVIVSKDNRPISFGYNGFIAQCDESYMTFDKPEKDLLSIHAEMNAIIFAQESIKDSTVYVTHASCENCFKHLVQAGVKEIIYEEFDTHGHFMTPQRVDIISRIIKATKIICRNINGKSFLQEAGVK